MRKIFFIFFLIGVSGISSNAATSQNPDDSQKGAVKKDGKDDVIAGIALTVNGDPITLYQIAQEEKKLKIDKKKAIDVLIADRLKNQEIKRLKINVDDSRLDEEIDNVAKRNGMDRDSFIGALMREGISFSKYKNQLKDQMETQELLRNILLSNVNTAGESEMRDYYNKHKDEFSVPQEVQTVRFVSKDPQALKKATENPMMNVTGVDRGEEKISVASLNPQVAGVFVKTPKDSFTPILNAGDGNYVSFLIKDKIGKTEVPFDQAKNFIAQKLVESSQDRILDEYFEKMRVKAKIRVIRE